MKASGSKPTNPPLLPRAIRTIIHAGLGGGWGRGGRLVLGIQVLVELLLLPHADARGHQQAHLPRFRFRFRFEFRFRFRLCGDASSETGRSDVA